MLLMLALPLQALAGASMLDCTFAHQTAAEAMAMADEMMAGCHEAEPSNPPPEQHDCKHCAACALASVLPMPVADSAAIMPVSHRFASQPATSFSGFIPDGPERPPRPALA
jgi:hypothetical protein